MGDFGLLSTLMEHLTRYQYIVIPQTKTIMCPPGISVLLTKAGYTSGCFLI